MRSKPTVTISDSTKPKAPWALTLAVIASMAFMLMPILIIAVYAFNDESSAFTFPPPSFTLKWFSKTLERSDVFASALLSLEVAAVASAFAIILGVLAALAVYRRQFVGRDSLNLMFNLPIALPGIITGIALLSSLRLLDLEPGFITIVIGHTTFCVVMVYNTVVARLRRIPPSLIESSMDLGANSLQTFWHIVLPAMASAILAGGILAFALSFDEIIVTTFTAGSERTLPIWLLNQLAKPRDMPITNVVALGITVVTVLPIIFAYRLTIGTEGTEGAVK